MALVGYLLCGLGFTYRIWQDPVRSTAGGGGGDAALFLSFLSNSAASLWAHQGHGLLVSHALNAPVGVNTMWNTSLLMPGILLSPVTRLAGPVLALNLLLLLGPVLSAWSAYLCSGRFVSRYGARLVVGLLFGFSPALLSAELGHLHLTLLALVPVMLLLGVDLLVCRGGVTWRALALGALVGLQLLTGEEVLALTGVAGAVLAGVLAVQHRSAVRPRLRPVLRGVGIAAVAAAVVAGYPLCVQLFGPALVHGSVQPVDVYDLDPVNLLLPNSVPVWRLNLLPAVPSLRLNDAENMGYLGLPLVSLLGVIAWTRRRCVTVRATAVAAVILIGLALGDTLHLAGGRKAVPLPWDLTRATPLLNSLLPVRWMLLVDLFVAVLLGLWLDGVRAPKRQAARYAIVLAALLPLVPHPLNDISPTHIPAYFTAADRPARETVLVLPYPTHRDATAMAWQAASGMSFAMPGGYFIGPQAQGRAGFGDFPVRATERTLVGLEAGRTLVRSLAVRAAARDDLAFWGVQDIVLGPTPHQRQLAAFVRWLTGEAPTKRAGVLLWSHPRVTAS
jgi:hypothetical protein